MLLKYSTGSRRARKQRPAPARPTQVAVCAELNRKRNLLERLHRAESLQSPYDRGQDAHQGYPEHKDLHLRLHSRRPRLGHAAPAVSTQTYRRLRTIS